MSIDGKLEINSDLFTAIKWKVYRVIIGGNGVGLGISDGVERIIIRTQTRNFVNSMALNAQEYNRKRCV